MSSPPCKKGKRLLSLDDEEAAPFMAAYHQARLDFWNIAVLMVAGDTIFLSHDTGRILDDLETADAFLTATVGALTPARIVPQKMHRSIDGWRASTKEYLYNGMNRWLHDISNEIDDFSFGDIYHMFAALVSYPVIRNFLPDTVRAVDEVRQGVLPHTDPSSRFPHVDCGSYMELPLVYYFFNSVATSYGTAAVGLPRKWAHEDTPAPAQILWSNDWDILGERPDLVQPGRAAIVRLIRDQQPPCIIRQYLSFEGDAPPICMDDDVFSTILRHQDLEALKTLRAHFPELKTPSNTLELLGKSGFKKTSAAECLEWLLDHYPPRPVLISFAESDRRRYSTRVLLLLLKRGANPFTVGTISELRGKWPATWGVALDKFYLPLFNNWSPEQHHFLPKHFRASVRCLLLVNTRFHRTGAPYLQRQLLLMIIQCAATGLLIEMEQPRLLENETRERLVELAAQHRHRIRGFPTKGELVTALSPLVAYNRWMWTPFLTPKERGETYHTIATSDDERARLLINYHRNGDGPAIARLLPPLTEESKYAEANVLAHAIAAGDMVGTRALLQAGAQMTCSVKGWLELSRLAKDSRSPQLECLLLVARHRSYPTNLLAIALEGGALFLARTLWRSGCSSNPITELVHLHADQLPEDTLWLISEMLRFPNERTQDLREFYRLRIEAEMIVRFRYYEEMEEELRKLGLPCYGTKVEKLARLTEHAVNELMLDATEKGRDDYFSYKLHPTLYARLGRELRKALWRVCQLRIHPYGGKQ